jgi:hypothetical protein
MSNPTPEKTPVHVELDELETPVAPLHPAFGEARVGPRGELRVRTDLRAGLPGNIVQCAPTVGS